MIQNTDPVDMGALHISSYQLNFGNSVQGPKLTYFLGVSMGPFDSSTQVLLDCWDVLEELLKSSRQFPENLPTICGSTGSPKHAPQKRGNKRSPHWAHTNTCIQLLALVGYPCSVFHVVPGSILVWFLYCQKCLV